MKRIRLQIQVLPWQASLRDSADSQSQYDIKPWVQPEDPETTLQHLVDNIVTRYGRIYVGRGPLRVKELQDYWGSTLDLSDRISDIFDDRAASGDNLTSICKVLRYPPDQEELFNRTRFTSLLPESTARPQKRPPPPLFHGPERPLPSVELENREDYRETKRRRIDASESSRSPAGFGETIQRGSSQHSLVQVVDSQANRQRDVDRYASPASHLALPDPTDSAQNAAILESPARQGQANTVVQASSRPESPEIPLSFRAHQPTNARRSASASHFDQVAPPEPIQEDGKQNQPVATNSGIRYSPESVNRAAAEGLPDRERLSRRRSSGPEIYDDIETDTESLQERQTMFDVRSRRTSSKTPSRPPKPFKDLGNPVSASRRAPMVRKASPVPTTSTGKRSKIIGANLVPHLRDDRNIRSGFLQTKENASGENQTRNEHEETFEEDPSVLLPTENDAKEGHDDLASAEPINIYCSGKVSIDANLEANAGSPRSNPQKQNHQTNQDMGGSTDHEILQQSLSPKHPRRQQEANITDSESDAGSDNSGTSIKSSLVREIESAARKHTQIQSSESHMRESKEIPAMSSEVVKNAGYCSRGSAKNPSTSSIIKPSCDNTSTTAHVSVSTAKQKLFKEQSLIEEAKRAMLEAEGEKELQAERARVEKTTNTTNKNRRVAKSVAEGEILAKQSSQKHGPAHSHKVDAEATADQQYMSLKDHTNARTKQTRSRKLGSISKLLTENSLTSPTPDRDASSNGSATPSIISCEKKTITPIWPGRSGPKQISSSGNLSNSPTSKQSADSLLRSAMKGATMQTSKSGSPAVKRSNSVSTRQHSAMENYSDFPELKSRVEKTAVPDSSKEGNVKTNSNRKVQSTLKTDRDKKLKGRAIDRIPSPTKIRSKSTPSPSGNSEDDVSSYLEEEARGWSGSKAGPSNRRKASSRSVVSRDSTSAAPHPIDPAVRPSMTTSTRSSSHYSDAIVNMQSENDPPEEKPVDKSEKESESDSSSESAGQKVSPFVTQEAFAKAVNTKTKDTSPSVSSSSASSDPSTTSDSASSQVDPTLIQLSPKKNLHNKSDPPLQSSDHQPPSRDSSVSSTGSTTSSTSATTPKPTTTNTSASTRHTSATPSVSTSSTSEIPPSAQRPQPSQHSPLFLTQQISTQQPSAVASPTLEVSSTTQYKSKSLSRSKSKRYPTLSELSRSARDQSPAPAAAKKASHSKNVLLSPFGDSDDNDSVDQDSESSSSEDEDAGAEATLEKAGSKTGRLPGMKGLLRRMFSSQ